MTLNSTHKALQLALDCLDDYETVNELNSGQLQIWRLARRDILAAMGATAAIHCAA